MEKGQSLYHGTSFEKVCEILRTQTLVGKKEENVSSFVSFTENRHVAFWFGDITIEFPHLKPHVKKIEYGNKEWAKENPEIVNYVIRNLDRDEENPIDVFFSMKDEEEYVAIEQFPFDLTDIVIHIGHEDEWKGKEYEAQIRKAFGEDIKIIVNDLYVAESQNYAMTF